MSRKVRFIVHIGTEKTGTTTLQGYLHRTQAQLQERGIAYYASPGRIEARGLSAAAIGDTPADDYLQQEGIVTPEQRQVFREKMTEDFQRAMSSLDGHIHTVVISSEHFHSRLRQPHQLQWLKDLLSPWAAQVQIVVYLRAQTDMLTSFYSTVLRNGEVRNLEVLGTKSCHAGNHFYNYRTLLELWGKVFGKNALTPRLFTADNLIQGDIVADFAAVMGTSSPQLEALKLPRQNESINPAGQALLRGINKAHRRAENALPAGDCRLLQLEVMAVFSGPGERLPLAVAKELQSAFEASNQWVCEQWFKERSALFPPVSHHYHGKKRSLAFSSEQLALAQTVVSRLERPDVKGVPELDSCAPYLRDAAVALEGKDTTAARRIMAMAHCIRPHGPFIRGKLGEYRAQRGILQRMGEWFLRRGS